MRPENRSILLLFVAEGIMFVAASMRLVNGVLATAFCVVVGMAIVARLKRRRPPRF